MIPNIKEKIEISTMQICIIEVNNLFKLKQIYVNKTAFTSDYHKTQSVYFSGIQQHKN
jgi:hypothetical protein